MDKRGYLLPVRFCCVFHCGRPLVSHQTETENYTHIVQEVLRSVDLRPVTSAQERKLTIPIDRFQVHLLSSDHVTFCCVTVRTNQVYQPFFFLNTVRSRFLELPTLVTRAPKAVDHEFDREFGPVLASIVYEHNVGQGGNRLLTLMSQVEDVKQVMLDNVTRILERGENLDEILAKTEDLEAQGTDFRRSTRQVQRSVRWKNIKMWLVISGILGVVLTVAALFFFGVIHIND